MRLFRPSSNSAGFSGIFPHPIHAPRYPADGIGVVNYLYASESAILGELRYFGKFPFLFSIPKAWKGEAGSQVELEYDKLICLSGQ